jgi:hypothetical protein
MELKGDEEGRERKGEAGRRAVGERKHRGEIERRGKVSAVPSQGKTGGCRCEVIQVRR